MGPKVETKRRPQRNAGVWSSTRILNSSSPILSYDIQKFLNSCLSNWDVNYNEEEKRKIIKTLPPNYQKFDLNDEGKLQCPLSKDFVREDNCIKQAVSKFKIDVSEGCYQAHWQNQARRAMQERQDGKFDDYLLQYAEETFNGGLESNDDSEHVDNGEVVDDVAMVNNDDRKDIKNTCSADDDHTVSNKKQMTEANAKQLGLISEDLEGVMKKVDSSVA